MVKNKKCQAKLKIKITQEKLVVEGWLQWADDCEETSATFLSAIHSALTPQVFNIAQLSDLSEKATHSLIVCATVCYSFAPEYCINHKLD